MSATPGTSHPSEAPRSIMASAYLATTIGTFALVMFNAFETLAVTTVMPDVARDLDGFSLYALAFAAPFAGGVIGMVAGGLWSDRAGPVVPLLTAIGFFAAGLVVCGLAPTMEVLVAGRLVQGLGGGATLVGLYVVVGLIYPATLQPSIFASFAAAWVLPSVFGPSVAAGIAHVAGWRWVFLAVAILDVLALALVFRALAGLRRAPARGPTTGGTGRLAWAALAAGAVVVIEPLASHADLRVVWALIATTLVAVAVRPLLPPGTLLLAPGLAAAVGVRGAISAGFFASQAYLTLLLQERWQWTTGEAGLALTVVGIVWAIASWAQASPGAAWSDRRCMIAGAVLLCAGTGLLCAVVWLRLPAGLVIASFAVSASGMGLSFPRTNVATLAASTDADRGFNSSAIAIADAMSSALALALCGVAFAVTEQLGGDAFGAVVSATLVFAAIGVLAARRTAGA